MPTADDPTGRTDAELIREAKRRHGTIGAVIAAAGLGISEVLEGRKKRDDGAVVVETSSQPVDLDEDGIRVESGEQHLAAPALERKDPLPATRRPRRRPRHG